MTPLAERSPRDRQHLLQVALALFQLGHCPDTIACALGCHEGLSISDAIQVANDAGTKWSAMLWTYANEGVPLPVLDRDTVKELLAKVGTKPPGAALKASLVAVPRPSQPPPDPPAPPAPPAPGRVASIASIAKEEAES